MLHRGEQERSGEDLIPHLIYLGGEIQFFKSCSTLNILTYLKIAKLNITKGMCPPFVLFQFMKIQHWGPEFHYVPFKLLSQIHFCSFCLYYLSNMHPLGNWCSFHCKSKVCEKFVYEIKDVCFDVIRQDIQKWQVIR